MRTKKVVLAAALVLAAACAGAAELSTAEQQIRYEFALDITDYTGRVRQLTKEPLPDSLPASEYMAMTREEAFAHYKQIADADPENLLAQCVVGYCFLEGVGTAADEASARSYYQKAYDKDFAPAVNTFGLLSDDDNVKFALYERASSQNYLSALYNLYSCYAEGRGCEQSLEKAEAVLLKIRDLHLDDEDIYCVIAEFHQEVLEEPDSKVLPYYIEAAERGNRTAIFQLWFDFYSKYREYDAEGVGENRAKWYRRYNERAFADRLERVQNEAEKIPYLLKRAAAGELYAINKVVMYYKDTLGFHANRIKAFEWEKKAADLGDVQACFNVAEGYAYGKYCPKDFTKAISYYNRATVLAGADPDKHYITPKEVKRLAFASLGVYGFINRYIKSVEEYASSYLHYYGEDLSFVNPEEALDFCEHYAESDRECALAVAYCYYLDGSKQTALQYLKSHGLEDAASFLSYEGDENDPNSREEKNVRTMEERDMRLEQEALEKQVEENPNDGRALFELAKCYNHKDDLENRRKAFELFKRSFDNSCADACYYLANVYENGSLFDSDIQKVGEILQKGSELGNASCMVFLGEMYEKGTYFDPEQGKFVQDFDKAIELFKKAAKTPNYYQAKANLENYNIKPDADDEDEDDMYWFYHSTPKKDAKPFDWDSWTFGDFDFSDESDAVPEYKEDEGYWAGTQKIECSLAPASPSYFATTIDSLKTGTAYRIVIAEELTKEKLGDMYRYFTESDHAASCTIDLDLSRCSVPVRYLPEHAICGCFRNLYLPDDVVFMANGCLDVYADKVVFGSRLSNFTDPFESGKYGLLDFTQISEERFSGRIAYRIAQLKVNYMRMVPIKANFEFITVEDTHSLKIMRELKETLQSNPEKKYVVDFSHSAYTRDPMTGDPIPLPKNFMAKQDNLYYLILGGCDDVELPENFCRGCRNLQSVVMWDYDDVGSGAFKGVNKNCTIVDRSGQEYLVRSLY